MPASPSPYAERTDAMDWNVMRRRQCMRQVPALLVPYLTRGDLPWIAIAGWMLAGVFLMLVIAGAMPIGEGEAMHDTDRHNILQAHPEWPSEVRAAVVTGIICAGMSPDMVRAAWGRPTRMSAENGINPREIWYYEGRPRAVERLGGQVRNDAEAGEWTVSFVDGRVIAWTD
jgi:hypothetical protein